MLKILKYTRTASGRLWASPGSLTNTALVLNSTWCSRLFLRTVITLHQQGGDQLGEICRSTVPESLLPARPCLSHWARCGPKVFLSMTMWVMWPWPTHLSLLKTTAPACPHQLLLCLGEPWFRRDSSQVPCADTLQSNIQGTAGLVIPKHTPKDSYRDVHGYLSTYLVIFLSTHFSYNHKLYLPLPPTSTDNIIWKLNLDISSSTCHLCRGISGRSWPDIWLVSLILTPVYS